MFDWKIGTEFSKKKNLGNGKLLFIFTQNIQFTKNVEKFPNNIMLIDKFTNLKCKKKIKSTYNF